MTINGTAVTERSTRIDWVDYAKGICIVMVVMMHSTLGVEKAAGETGCMHAFVAFAQPFRMPDFFMISGLFLAVVIDRDWRTYLDRKVVHFAYFYVLWVTIQFAFKAPGFAAEHGWPACRRLYLESFIEPFGTLWFIYLLPIFFVVTKLARGVPPLVDLARRRRAGDRADRDRLDRRSTSSPRASSISTPATCSRRYVFALSRSCARQGLRWRSTDWRCGRSSTAASCCRASAELPLISLALGFAGAVRHHRDRHAAGADAPGSTSCAIAASIRS